jgi:ribosomal protein S18
MAISQREKQTPAHDPSLLVDLSSHIFSMDYLYFLPAILASLLWHLLPIPKVGAMCLFLWSLPLYTAGAATALNKGPNSLSNLIYSRCPIQGIFILVYAFVALAVFFFVLLLANGLGWIGSARGEFFTALLMGAGIMVPMVRIWPDYLLRVIHPKYGLGDSWISADFPRGLGPTFLTAWKYSSRAKLPASAVSGALVSIFVVTGGVFFLHADLCSGHDTVRFLGNIAILGLIFPVAHLVLVRIGSKLLAANDIDVTPVSKKDSPPISPPPVSTARKQTQFFDKDAIVDERVFDYVNSDKVEVITGWLIQNNNRTENKVAFYNRNSNRIDIIRGPWKTGQWRHQSSGTDVSLEDAFFGKYPISSCIDYKHIEIIKEFILKNVKIKNTDS